jgi:predicted DCC family thiol-disulfide oxidoreductase YuxK
MGASPDIIESLTWIKKLPELSVLYDGHCSLCSASAARLRRKDRRGRLELLDLHDPSVLARFPELDLGEAMRLMMAVDQHGHVFAGVDAWARIGSELPGWKSFAWILRVPGIHLVARGVYSVVARNRYRWNREKCADSSCAIHFPKK